MVLFGQIFSASIIDEECGRFLFFFWEGWGSTTTQYLKHFMVPIKM